MISNLPRDLVDEILSRVPLKSMIEPRLTCKKWDTLSKTQSFTKMHTKNATATAGSRRVSQVIILMDYKLYLSSVVFDDDPSIIPKGKLTCLDKQVKISKVFHCEGLLLCILKGNDKLVVWNPYLGQTRWIEPSCCPRNPNLGPARWIERNCYPRRLHEGNYAANEYMYALGYENKKNKSCRSHKILKILFKQYFFCYEIYDFETGLWRTLDALAQMWYIKLDECGVQGKHLLVF
ncbi:unnamed protein product [Microthlaspi erraticum]|uniref:F-box domain-containing protein n=1 Tax=Microthlaspi erraticum TaxID=1685480 RepID=A0A6D2HPK4_9BRAS|nr:unnamed protein product [Microthlaspi erraticum]